MIVPPGEYRAFLDAAGVLCGLIESVAEPSVAERPSVNRVRVAVAEVLAAGWRPPAVEPATGEFEVPEISHAEWRRVFAVVQEWIGESEYYSTNQVLRGRGTRTVTVGSVADDLADIWRDLRSSLEAERHDMSWRDAVWQARFDLETHWGTHALEVLRALHSL
ncbi:MAG: DUF5063 domain-containing protein [Propionicimonas sp.]|uniref:DUF5063 domain-containing protein n=1 Tax=Propionicimonas sp. TaxID=1955623 RepID=UPI003D0C4EA6